MVQEERAVYPHVTFITTKIWNLRRIHVGPVWTRTPAPIRGAFQLTILFLGINDVSTLYTWPQVVARYRVAWLHPEINAECFIQRIMFFSEPIGHTKPLQLHPFTKVQALYAWPADFGTQHAASQRLLTLTKKYLSPHRFAYDTFMVQTPYSITTPTQGVHAVDPVISGTLVPEEHRVQHRSIIGVRKLAAVRPVIGVEFAQDDLVAPSSKVLRRWAVALLQVLLP